MAGVEHRTFRHNQSLTNITVYIQVYSHLYVRVLRTLNFDTLYATRFEFGMVLTLTNTFDYMVKFFLGLSPGLGQCLERITYCKKFKFDIILTQNNTFGFIVECPLGWSQGSEYLTLT